MNLRFHPGLWLTFLLVSCDKPQQGDDSVDADSPQTQVTRSSRSRPVGESNPAQQFRTALDQAMTIESPEERDMAVAEIVRKALEIDPSFSAEAYRELSAESAEKPQLLEEGARRLLARSEAEALAWADLLGTDVDAAKGVIAEVLAESDPLHAVKVLVDSGISLEDPNGSAVMVIQHWGASAPEAAATWAVSVNAGESRKAAIKAIAPQWMMADSKAATDWMATLDDSNVRQEVSHAMAEALVGNPEFINQSILQYADPKIRADLEQQVRQLRLDTESEPEAEAEPER